MSLNLSAIAKLEVIWIINPKVPLHSVPNTGFDMSYFSSLL